MKIFVDWEDKDRMRWDYNGVVDDELIFII